jgi:hypothetical protein
MLRNAIQYPRPIVSETSTRFRRSGFLLRAGKDTNSPQATLEAA